MNAPAPPTQPPIPTENAILPAIPWYRSPVVIAQVSAAASAIVAVLPKNDLITSLGLADPRQVASDVNTVFALIAGVASIVGVIVRAHSRVQPVTVTQIGASCHPNTLAVEAAKQACEKP